MALEGNHLEGSTIVSLKLNILPTSMCNNLELLSTASILTRISR